MSLQQWTFGKAWRYHLLPWFCRRVDGCYQYLLWKKPTVWLLNILTQVSLPQPAITQLENVSGAKIRKDYPFISYLPINSMEVCLPR